MTARLTPAQQAMLAWLSEHTCRRPMRSFGLDGREFRTLMLLVDRGFAKAINGGYVALRARGLTK